MVGGWEGGKAWWTDTLVGWVDGWGGGGGLRELGGWAAEELGIMRLL